MDVTSLVFWIAHIAAAVGGVVVGLLVFSGILFVWAMANWNGPGF